MGTFERRRWFVNGIIVSNSNSLKSIHSPNESRFDYFYLLLTSAIFTLFRVRIYIQQTAALTRVFLKFFDFSVSCTNQLCLNYRTRKMSSEIIHSVFLEDFIGCPYPFCRQRICDFNSVTGYFQHGYIVNPMDCFFEESGKYFLCVNCHQCIGEIQSDAAFLECYRYKKKVIENPISIILFTTK